MAGKTHFYKNLTPKQRIIFLIVSLVLISIIIYSVTTLITRFGKIKTTVQFAPYTATVTLNNQKIKNPSTIYLEPGNYHIQVSAEHFESYNTTITIDQDHHYIIGTLTATDSEGEQYISSHQAEFTNTEGLIGIALNEEGSARKKQYPILQYLPINNSLYSISYTYDSDNTTPIISVKADLLYIDTAVNKLKSLDGVDLTGYQIIFNTNPFSSYENNSANNPLDCIKQSINLEKFTLTDGQYLGNTYYFTQAYINDYDLDYSYAHYRILLQKEGDNWHIINTPQPILTTANTPNVPKEILDTANSF